MADRDDYFGTNLPPELIPGALSVRRRQRMAEGLLQRGTTPPQGFMAGRVFIPPNALNVLSSAVSSGLGAYKGREAERETAGLGQQYQELLGKAVNRYLEGSRPRQVVEPDVGAMTGGLDEQDIPRVEKTIPPVPANERIVHAMTSGFAPLQRMGELELQAQLKGQMTPEKMADLRLKVTPESFVQYMMSGNPAVLQPKPEYAASEGMLYEKGDPFGAQGPRPIAGYGPVQEAPGNRGIVYQQQQGTGKINWGPATTTVTQTNLPEDKARLETTKALLAPLEKKLADSSVAATGAKKDLDVIQKAAGYLTQGVRTGMFRDGLTAVSQLATQLGFQSDDPTVSSTRLFAATMSERTLANSRALGSGTAFSNTDREYLAKMKEGKDFPLEGLTTLLEHAMIDAVNVMNQHNALVDKAGAMPGAPEGWADTFRQDIGTIDMNLPAPGGPRPAAPVGTTRPYTGTP